MVNAGAHVYVEKPIGHTIMEGRAMVNAARAAGRVVRVGTHRRVSPHNVSGMKFLKEGRAGKIGMVRAFGQFQDAIFDIYFHNIGLFFLSNRLTFQRHSESEIPALRP